jgi:acetate kinase
MILSINSGSSSLKFSLYSYKMHETITTGIVERVGMDGSFIEFVTKGKCKQKIEHHCENHEVAIELMIKTMTNQEYGILNSIDQIKAVGHRVLHGGDIVKHSVVINDAYLKAFKELTDLGPLHMPPNITGIEAAKAVLPNVPHMAIMDTAFHQTMPAHTYMYALPYEWYDKHKVRRYGFHGTSHLYVSKRTSVLLGKEPKDTNAVILHIGNGASACAIKNGKCFDTSMGLTPLEGLIMGTRSGDFDPAVIEYIIGKENITPSQMNTILNKKSGHIGITGKYSDRRDIVDNAEKGDERCKLALEMECHRLKKYIGAYIASLGGADAVVFTAGVGEMSPVIREKTLEGLECLGIKVDKEKNRICKNRNAEFEISTPDSKVKIFVIPTDEEIVFIEDVVALLHGTYKDHGEFNYSFQKKDYINYQRSSAFEEDVKTKPELKSIAIFPK